MTRTLVALITLAAASTLTLGSSPASAQELEPGFWRSVREPGYARAMHLTQQGAYLYRAWQQKTQESRGPNARANAHERNAVLEGAIERFTLAHRLVPTEPMFLFELARATADWERPERDGMARMNDEALTLFSELRALDAQFEAANVAFAIAIIHTRTHRFAEAAEEYLRAIGRAIQKDSVHWSNLAEVTMLAGDLEAAVGYYERSIDVADETGQTRVLALWGLAVAFDRLGEHQRALETADDALTAGDDTMAPLRDGGVFFEPEHEIHWYEGLGHAALSRRMTDDDEGRQRHLAASRESFRRYLAEGGDTSEWASLAEQHAREAPGGHHRGRLGR